MEINIQPKAGTDIEIEAMHLYEASKDYREAYRKEYREPAVLWVKYSDGSAVVMVDSSYLPLVMKNIQNVANEIQFAEEMVFAPDTTPTS